MELATHLPFSPSSAMILLIVWSAFDDDSALTSKTSSKVNWLNDDTYHCVFVTVLVSSTNRAMCALYKDILHLLNEESISGARSGRASL